MEPAATVINDRAPSTGDPIASIHISFRIPDGSTMAIFEAPELPPRAGQTHPGYAAFDRTDLPAKDRDHLLQWREWLKVSAVSAIGPIDHEGLIPSIHFYDPCGIRLRSRRGWFQDGITKQPRTRPIWTPIALRRSRPKRTAEHRKRQEPPELAQ